VRRDLRHADLVDLTVAVVFRATILIWAAFEVSLSVRDRRRGQGGTGRDRGTRLLISLLIPVAALLAALTAAKVPAPWTAVGNAVIVAGTALMWLGLAVRAWAVATLGRAFRTTVEVDTDQTVVTRGPYRRVRHPSYTGLLLTLAGIGLCLDSWLGLLICTVVPGVAVLHRIRVEEAELARVLGEPYRDYRQHTKRLVPGLW
jgi:protein-S-isoprenylcysteine O-methyltransferase Ste14